jgi:hypothetical protein
MASLRPIDDGIAWDILNDDGEVIRAHLEPAAVPPGTSGSPPRVLQTP